MTPNAGHAQKCARSPSGHYPDNNLQSLCDRNGMFPEASPALPFLHFLNGCSQQVSLDFLKAEHILSPVALYSLGQASCDNFHLSYIIFIQILTANCMGMHFLTVINVLPCCSLTRRHISQGMRNRNFYQWLSYVCYLLPPWWMAKLSQIRDKAAPGTLGWGWEAGNCSLAVCMEHGPCSYPGAE